MLVLDSDAIQASAAIVAAGDEIVLVLRRGLMSAADLAAFRGLLAPVMAALPGLGSDSLRNTG